MANEAGTRGARETTDIVIIGSGFGGLCAAINLKRRGRERFVLLEKNAGVGGTWRENTYPGAACDVPAMFYSFSFELNPDWSGRFPRQPEILAYLERCAEKYGVLPHCRFNTEVREARFDEHSGRWTVITDDGDRIVAHALINATGQLNRPAWPQIPGRERFQGNSFHSACWDHTDNLTGKRVGVIGTGPSAVQFIPEIANQTGHLYVFQRTPNWMVPRPDPAYSERQRALHRRRPWIMRLKRFGIWAMADMAWPMFTMGSGHPLRRLAERLVVWNMHRHISDPDLREKLTPHYPMGCKRVQIEDDYYPALHRDNVTLITDSIEEIVADGIRTRSGKHIAMDTLIYATGFKSTQFLTPMEVYGRQGKSLNERWAQGAEAYLGVTVPGFPNFFMLYGPNTNLGHNSIVFMIEQQVRYILGCLDLLDQYGARYMDVFEGSMTRWQHEAQRQLAKTVWSHGCNSWYKTAEGRITNNWPYSTLTYWLRMRRPYPEDYQWVGAEGHPEPRLMRA